MQTLTKQSKILKKGSKKGSKVVTNVVKKLAKKGEVKTKQLPEHHFKMVKVKRGLAGLGLFAGEDIKKGELIIEYIGNILTKEEVDNVKSNQYLFEVTRNKTIDGSVRWNIARYCNHACEEAANAESEIKKGRVFVKAIKDIKEGDEIVYDYGEEFVNEFIAPKGCRCVAKEHSYNARVMPTTIG
jgi:spore maturation protein CgeB